MRDIEVKHAHTFPRPTMSIALASFPDRRRDLSSLVIRRLRRRPAAMRCARILESLIGITLNAARHDRTARPAPHIRKERT